MRKSDRENGEEARAIQCVVGTDYLLAPTTAPLLGQGGEAGPQATAGVVRTVARGQISSGIAATRTTRVALRDRRRRATAVAACHVPSSAEEGSFPVFFQFATEPGLRLVRLVLK